MEISPRSKRTLPKVDLTAMVDLGFLLITFFMLATSFTKENVMEVFKPDTEGEFPYPESKSAIIFLGQRDKVFTYTPPDHLSETDGLKIDSMDYNAGGLRKFIQRRQDEVKVKWGNKDMLFVVIKPLPDASFKNMVDALDEMFISKVQHYAIVPVTAVDSIVLGKINYVGD